MQIGNGDIGANSFGLGPVVNNGTFILNEPGGNEGVINPTAVGSDPMGDNLQGSGNVLVQGGTLQLQSPNSYTGTTTVEVAGVLEVRAFANALGATSTGTTVNGGAIFFRGVAGNIDEPITFNGGRIRVDQYDIGTGNVVSSAVLTNASTIDVGSLADFSVTIDSNTSAGNTFTIESNITGTGGLNFNAIVNAGSTLFVPGNFSHNGNIVKTGTGTLSLTGTNTHSGATLVNAGSLTAGGTYTVGSGQVLGGNGGMVIDNTIAASGGKIAVGNGPLVGVNETILTYDASITYVDADFATNTTLADGTPASAGVDFVDVGTGVPIDNNRWDVRTFANNGTVIESNGSSNGTNGGENAPALRTTISDLTPGEEFQVFAFGWSASNATWRLRASLTDPDSDGTPDGQVDQSWFLRQTAASTTILPATYVSRDMGGLNPGPITTDDWDGVDPITQIGRENGGVFTNGTGVILSRDGNRGMSMAPLGTAIVDANGNIHVYIDDLVTTSGNNRTWYDGVGFGSLEEIITPLPTFVTDLQVFTIDNDLTLDAGSSLEIELLADNVFDKLVVTGAFTANGSLDVVYGSGTPDLEVGDTFDILDWGTLVGSFSAVNLPTLAGGLAWNQSLLLSDGILSIVAAPDGLPGDFNGDGFVDAADYTVWRDNLGGDAAALGGNGSGAATVVAADYTLWRANFGNVLPPSGSLGGGANVPEPASMLLTLIGGMALVALRRRR